MLKDKYKTASLILWLIITYLILTKTMFIIQLCLIYLFGDFWIFALIYLLTKED